MEAILSKTSDDFHRTIWPYTAEDRTLHDIAASFPCGLLTIIFIVKTQKVGFNAQQYTLP
jgi:hypothetical protein